MESANITFRDTQGFEISDPSRNYSVLNSKHSNERPEIDVIYNESVETKYTKRDSSPIRI